MIGNLFYLSISTESKSLGASTGIFGIFGAGFGFLIYNWFNMDYE